MERKLTQPDSDVPASSQIPGVALNAAVIDTGVILHAQLWTECPRKPGSVWGFAWTCGHSLRLRAPEPQGAGHGARAVCACPPAGWRLSLLEHGERGPRSTPATAPASCAAALLLREEATPPAAAAQSPARPPLVPAAARLLRPSPLRHRRLSSHLEPPSCVSTSLIPLLISYFLRKCCCFPPSFWHHGLKNLFPLTRKQAW